MERNERYVLGSGQTRVSARTPYDKASTEKKKVLEREAVVANIIKGNKTKVCEERGIPLDVFTVLWDE